MGTQTGLNPPRVALKEASYVVCTGLFDDQNEKPEDYDLTLAAMRARDLEFICANPDHVVHVGEKLLYCSGAIASRYEQSGGKVIQAGKPHAPIYERAMEIARARLGRDFAKPGVLAIGDGMRTDVKGGVDFGLDVLFVAGGIHQAEVAGGADKFAAFLANAESRPKAALDSLRW